MVRRHFIAGDEKPDFIITYYAPQHIPFSSNYKGVLRGFSHAYDFDNENNTVFTCVLDKWKDGVGEYGIKILNWVDGVWYNMWGYRKFVDLTNSNIGSLGVYIDIGNNVQEDIMLFSDTITDVIFPNEIKHLIGPAVSDYLDEYNRSVVNITLPENLETLSNNVLRSLHVLKTITIPSSVIYMGDNTLKIDCENDNIMSLTPGNQSLEEIIMKPIIPPSTDAFAIPIGVYRTDRYINPNLKIRVYADCIDTYKNDDVWGQYNDLYDTINNAIVYYDGGRLVYMETDDITSINITFPWNTTKVYLPNTLVRIDPHNFGGRSSLTYVNIPDSVTNIVGGSFKNCTSLTSIVLGNGVTTIFAETFSGCNSLTSIVIPASVTSIGEKAFSGCSSLTSIVIPDGVTTIYGTAFYGCRSLTSVTIGESVTSIGSSTFSSCDSLTSVTINSDAIVSKDYNTSNCLRSIFGPQVSKYIIGNGVTSIGNYAFYDCINITSITIPNSVTRIGQHTFLNCTGFTSITIPESVTSIAYKAFASCSSLSSITYQGTKDQWKIIAFDSGWDDNVPATVVHCTDGDVEI